jgi:hypothetical protein
VRGKVTGRLRPQACLLWSRSHVAAAARADFDSQLSVYLLLHRLDVTDDADRAATRPQTVERRHGKFECVSVERTKSFVNEEGVQLDCARSGTHNFGESERQREGCEEGFAAGQGMGSARPARVLVKDFET